MSQETETERKPSKFVPVNYSQTGERQMSTPFSETQTNDREYTRPDHSNGGQGSERGGRRFNNAPERTINEPNSRPSYNKDDKLIGWERHRREIKDQDGNRWQETREIERADRPPLRRLWNG